jgi:hypothetical protein
MEISCLASYLDEASRLFSKLRKINSHFAKKLATFSAG